MIVNLYNSLNYLNYFVKAKCCANEIFFQHDRFCNYNGISIFFSFIGTYKIILLKKHFKKTKKVIQKCTVDTYRNINLRLRKSRNVRQLQ